MGRGEERRGGNGDDQTRDMAMLYISLIECINKIPDLWSHGEKAVR
jgi:hypothetical protein